MIGLISINHKTASLSRREQFALGDEEAVQLITQWKEELSLLGGFILSSSPASHIRTGEGTHPKSIPLQAHPSLRG